ncbi:MAG TPA: MerR family transcriptional regulator [Selenomonadales bacterium]|nr:MerR family transcriptional regulator [Selenomonadales bacterium]
MGYTIKQVGERLQLSAYTLRYYEKEGLLPVVARDENGNRAFTDADIEWILLIRCLRDTGMSVGEIKRYVALCRQGDQTIDVRREIMERHKRAVEQKIEQMKNYLRKIDKKLGYYDAFIAGKGTDCCNPLGRSPAHRPAMDGGVPVR